MNDTDYGAPHDRETYAAAVAQTRVDRLAQRLAGLEDAKAGLQTRIKTIDDEIERTLGDLGSAKAHANELAGKQREG